MDTLRQISINKLKRSIKTKSLTCYHVSDYNIQPLYYDADFQTCCAVGELFDKSSLIKDKIYQFLTSLEKLKNQ